jgi:hypothetical protein
VKQKNISHCYKKILSVLTTAKKFFFYFDRMNVFFVGKKNYCSCEGMKIKNYIFPSTGEEMWLAMKKKRFSTILIQPRQHLKHFSFYLWLALFFFHLLCLLQAMTE